jgi:hypothetical protein
MAGFKGVLAGLAGVALLAAGGQATARLAPPGAAAPAANTVSPLILTAPPKPDPVVNPESQFVRQHLPEGWSDQFPRFRDDVCVDVQGLPKAFDAFIAQRIIAVANQVHAPVAKATDCKPNIHVIFTPTPQAQLDDIAKRKDILIGVHYNSQFKRLTTFNRPIGAWYVTRVRDDSGKSHLELNVPPPASISEAIDGDDRPHGRAGSRLSNGMTAEVVHSLILADANKVAGEKIDAIADYVAVLALAKWRGLERCNAIPTILNLMAEECVDPPRAATAADLALLTGLYAVDPRELGSQQRASIASRIAAAAKAEPERPR